MEPSFLLSKGAIKEILEGQNHPGPCHLQILSITNNSCLVISDGVHSVEGVVIGNFDVEIHVDKYCIISVNDWKIVNRIIEIAGLTVLHTGNKVKRILGNPSRLIINIIPILFLNPYQLKWTIKARVVSRPKIKPYKNSCREGFVMNVLLVDGSGDINGIAFDDIALNLSELFQAQKVYYISNAVITLSDKTKTTCLSNYEIKFKSTTTIEECVDDDLPILPSFNFTMINELKSLPEGTSVDVIGVCNNAGELIKTTNTKTNEEILKRDITLLDKNGHSIKCTLWNFEAQDFDDTSYSVIALKSALISIFNGRTTIVYGFNTYIFNNPDIPQCNELRNWYIQGSVGLNLSSNYPIKRSFALVKRAISSQSCYVTVNITKSVVVGPPGVGKTAFGALLLNMQPVTKYKSTPIATRPQVRAVRTRRFAEIDKEEWVDVDKNPEIMLHMVADQIKLTSHDHTSTSLSVAVNTSTRDISSNESASVRHRRDYTSTNESINQYSHLSNQGEVVTLDPSEVKDILELIPKVEGKGELFKTNWHYFLDSGGQPQFADVSRAFIRNASHYFIVTKLTETLQDTPNFCYRDSENGQSLCSPRNLRMSNIQLIEHYIRSIMSIKASSCFTDQFKSTSIPFVAVIGTYLDEYSEEDHEKLETKNSNLLKLLDKFHHHLTFFLSNPGLDELIFPVNNLWTDDERREQSEILRRKLFPCQLKSQSVKIPLQFYIFDILVKNEIKSQYDSHGVILLEECQIIADKVKIKLDDVIQFFNGLNIYLYFEDIPSLEHLVFTDPHYLLEILSNLIKVSFCDNIIPGLSTNAPRILRNEGIFNKSIFDVKELSIQFVPPHFTQEHFLEFLEHTVIISKVSQDQYFLPAALSLTEPTWKSYESMQCDPLFIKFRCNVVLQGVFLTIINNLLRAKASFCFYLPDVKDDLCIISAQSRYVIELSSKGLTGSLVLIEKFRWIEVYFNGMIYDCVKVREVIEEAIEPCAEILGYKESALEYDVLPLCTYSEQHKDNDKQHPVSEIFLENRTAKCGDPFPLNKRQLCWFQPHTESDNNDALSAKPELHDLCRLLSDVTYKYGTIGTALKVPVQNYVYSSSQYNDILRDVLNHWINNGNNPNINKPVTWQTIIDVVEPFNYEISEKMRKFAIQSYRS